MTNNPKTCVDLYLDSFTQSFAAPSPLSVRARDNGNQPYIVHSQAGQAMGHTAAPATADGCSRGHSRFGSQQSPSWRELLRDGLRTLQCCCPSQADRHRGSG